MDGKDAFSCALPRAEMDLSQPLLAVPVGMGQDPAQGTLTLPLCSALPKAP